MLGLTRYLKVVGIGPKVAVGDASVVFVGGQMSEVSWELGGKGVRGRLVGVRRGCRGE